MGEKANKFVAAAGIIVAIVVGAGQFAGGFSMLFGPAQLPDCQSADASDLVRKIIADNFDVRLERLNEVAQIGFDESAQKRGCTATIDAAAEGVFEIAYDLTWHDREDKLLAAEVQVVGQRQ